MTQQGLGVLIGLLGGNENSVAAFNAGVGKVITSLMLEDDRLRFMFDDGYKMVLFDDGQSCYESRYMTTDDKLSDFVGAELLSAKVKDGPTISDRGEPHETAFLHVTTSIGTFVCETHNEHNGYYGGFLIIAQAA